MTTNRHRTPARRRLDVPSLILTLLGVIFGAIAYWLIEAQHLNALVIAPSIVAITIGVTHLLKWEAPRD